MSIYNYIENAVNVIKAYKIIVGENNESSNRIRLNSVHSLKSIKDIGSTKSVKKFGQREQKYCKLFYHLDSFPNENTALYEAFIKNIEVTPKITGFKQLKEAYTF